jgi:hypothetical protein
MRRGLRQTDFVYWILAFKMPYFGGFPIVSIQQVTSVPSFVVEICSRDFSLVMDRNSPKKKILPQNQINKKYPT